MSQAFGKTLANIWTSAVNQSAQQLAVLHQQKHQQPQQHQDQQQQQQRRKRDDFSTRQPTLKSKMQDENNNSTSFAKLARNDDIKTFDNLNFSKSDDDDYEEDEQFECYKYENDIKNNLNDGRNFAGMSGDEFKE